MATATCLNISSAKFQEIWRIWNLSSFKDCRAAYVAASFILAAQVVQTKKYCQAEGHSITWQKWELEPRVPNLPCHRTTLKLLHHVGLQHGSPVLSPLRKSLSITSELFVPDTGGSELAGNTVGKQMGQTKEEQHICPKIWQFQENRIAWARQLKKHLNGPQPLRLAMETHQKVGANPMSSNIQILCVKGPLSCCLSIHQICAVLFLMSLGEGRQTQTCISPVSKYLDLQYKPKCTPQSHFRIVQLTPDIELKLFSDKEFRALIYVLFASTGISAERNGYK